MEQISSEIRVGYSDRETNALLESRAEGERPFSRHFNQGEDFFLLLEGSYAVPHLPIHHDVRLPQPDPAYMAALRGVLDQVLELAPQVLKGLQYFFDPAEILRPCFYHLYRVEESLYLYLLRIDLTMRATEGTVIERGTNDTTPQYSSRRLFLETTIIPLDEVVRDDGIVKGFRIRQTISQTWIGEYGRGYFQQGIWMDMDLTKFFSRLFLPSGQEDLSLFPLPVQIQDGLQVGDRSLRLGPLLLDTRAAPCPRIPASCHGAHPGGDEECELLRGHELLPGAEGARAGLVVRALGHAHGPVLSQRPGHEGVPH